MGQLQPYRAVRFAGGSVSYGAQGICSKCHTRTARWMGVIGAAMWAFCDECARFMRPCTCYVVCLLPDGRNVLGGEDDCPIHGTGPSN